MLGYLAPSAGKPVSYALQPEKSDMPIDRRSVAIACSRPGAAAESLDREGFTRIAHRSAVDDFLDAGSVAAVYFGEIEQLIAEVTGASQCFALERPIIRTKRENVSTELNLEETAQLIHVDYTPTSVLAESGAALRHRGVDQLPHGRLAAYTIWRSISPPPQDSPLALCDLRTIDQNDLVLSDSYDANGSAFDFTQFFTLRYDSRHRWTYFADLNQDEVVIFKQFDSAIPGPSGVPHSAFVDASCAPGTPPRLSIEARVFAFFD